MIQQFHCRIRDILPDIRHRCNPRLIIRSFIKIIKPGDQEIIRYMKAQFLRSMTHSHRNIVIRTYKSIDLLPHFQKAVKRPCACHNLIITMQNTILFHKNSMSLQDINVRLHAVMILADILRATNIIDFAASMLRNEMLYEFFHHRIIVHSSMVQPRNFLKKRHRRNPGLLNQFNNSIGILSFGNIRNLQNNTVKLTEIRQRKNVIFSVIMFLILAKVAKRIKHMHFHIKVMFTYITSTATDPVIIDKSSPSVSNNRYLPHMHLYIYKVYPFILCFRQLLVFIITSLHNICTKKKALPHNFLCSSYSPQTNKN